MSYPITIRLSEPQERFFSDEIEAGTALGDCIVNGLKLTMDDYEGAQAMLSRFCSKRTGTTREYVSLTSLAGRLSNAIVKAAGV